MVALCFVAVFVVKLWFTENTPVTAHKLSPGPSLIRYGCTAAFKTGSFLFATTATSSVAFEGILKYSAHSNEWLEWIPYPDKFPVQFVYCAMDHSRNILYIYGGAQTISSVHLDDHKCSSVCIDSLPTDNLRCPLVVGDELYLFYSSSCCIWNTVNQEKSVIQRDISVTDIKQAVYVPTEHCIIVISVDTERAFQCWIWSLDKDTIESKGSFDIPDRMNVTNLDFATLAGNERYIMMTGPAQNGYYVGMLDRGGDEYELKECTMELPKNYHAAVTRSGRSARDYALICGFCRIQSTKAIPPDILNLMAEWAGCPEMLHFIEFNSSGADKPHFGFSTDDIISSLK